jgi:hypothetical protein
MRSLSRYLAVDAEAWGCKRIQCGPAIGRVLATARRRSMHSPTSVHAQPDVGLSVSAWENVRSMLRVGGAGFLSCAQEDIAHRDALERHIDPLRRSGMLRLWHAGLLERGADRTASVQEEIDGQEARPPGNASVRRADDDATHLVAWLEDARVRRRRRMDAGVSTRDIDEEILALKRRHREGGQVRQGDILGGRLLALAACSQTGARARCARAARDREGDREGDRVGSRRIGSRTWRRSARRCGTQKSAR